MPLRPPPGFEQAFAAPCPTCGVAVGDHATVEEHLEHLVIFLADPDRTADEVLEYFAGSLIGVQHSIHIGLPAWAIDRILADQVERLREVSRRRAGP